MRLFLTLFIAFIVSINSVFAYDLILPREKKSFSNAKYVLFMGKARCNESVTINDEKVFVASNGAFAHSIKLKTGENRIVVKSNYGMKVYKVYKESLPQKTEQELVEFEPRLYLVKNDNTPLRMSPEDFGMNRYSHLFKGTYLIVDGEKADFYRVFLCKDKKAWIAKSAVNEADRLDVVPKFLTMDTKYFKNASVHNISFSVNLPYIIEETKEELFFKVYNPFASENTVYTINIKKPCKYMYKTELTNGIYSFKVSEMPQCKNTSLSGLVVVVDAGHGGSEKGAIGCLGDNEKELNLAIANELKNILETFGAKVVMTRDVDGNVKLEDRVSIAKKHCAHLFLSIHLNSIPDIKMDIHKNRGTSVYYYNPNSKELASILEGTVSSALGTRKDGVKTASFAVIRPTDYVGVLVEVAYMINPLDSVIYLKENFAYDAANGIANGVLKYVNSQECPE